MKLKMLVAAMLLGSLSVSAESYRIMVVTTKSGEDFTVNLTSQLSTTFVGGVMILSDIYVHVGVPMSDVTGWYYSNTVVDEAESPVADDVNVAHNGASIDINGLKDNSRLSLVTIDGRVVMDATASQTFTVDLSGLTNGVYVLTVNDQSYKIAVNK